MLLFLKQLFKLFYLRGNYDAAISLRRVFCKIVLVIVLSPVESLRRNDFCDYGIGPVFLRLASDCFGDRFLIRITVQNDGPIRGAHVRTLPIQRGWVMRMKEFPKQIRIGHYGGIKFHLNHLCMTSSFRANLFVGRILCGSPSVTGDHRLYPINQLELGIETPKTATAKYRGFHV